MGQASRVTQLENGKRQPGEFLEYVNISKGFLKIPGGEMEFVQLYRLGNRLFLFYINDKDNPGSLENL